jgi:hypothetical protein
MSAAATRLLLVSRGALLSTPLPPLPPLPPPAAGGEGEVLAAAADWDECHVCGRRGFESDWKRLEKHLKGCLANLRRRRRRALDERDPRQAMRYRRRALTVVGTYEVRSREMSLLRVSAALGVTDVRELQQAGGNAERFPGLQVKSTLLRGSQIDVPATARKFRPVPAADPGCAAGADGRGFGPWGPWSRAEARPGFAPAADVALGSPVLGCFRGAWFRGVVLQIPCVATGFRWFIQYDEDDSLDFLPPSEVRILHEEADTQERRVLASTTSSSSSASAFSSSAASSSSLAPASVVPAAAASSSSSSSSSSRSRHQVIRPNHNKRARRDLRNPNETTKRQKKRSKTAAPKNVATKPMPTKRVNLSENPDSAPLPPWKDPYEPERSRRLGHVLQQYCADLTSGGESFGELIMHAALGKYASLDHTATTAAHADLNFLFDTDDLCTFSGTRPSLRFLKETRHQLWCAKKQLETALKELSSSC